MTDKYFFDTDCLSAFLWVHGESILAKLYSGRIILPAQVYEELEKVPHLLEKVDVLKNSGDLRVESMQVGSVEYDDYLKMTERPEKGMKFIGRGEAAGIAMAKQRNGTLASNNLHDILPYVEKYKIQHITTGEILIEAMRAGIVTESECNTVWANMIRKRRTLPTATFSEFLAVHTAIIPKSKESDPQE